jgi:hypothetical protein
MPNPIKIKNNSTPGAAPTTGQLITGELALNAADSKLYIKNFKKIFLYIID